jgi:hypothetical protein
VRYGFKIGFLTVIMRLRKLFAFAKVREEPAAFADRDRARSWPQAITCKLGMNQRKAKRECERRQRRE